VIVVGGLLILLIGELIVLTLRIDYVVDVGHYVVIVVVVGYYVVVVLLLLPVVVVGVVVGRCCLLRCWITLITVY